MCWKLSGEISDILADFRSDNFQHILRVMNTRAQSRKWYLEQSNWIISDEIADTDDGTAEDEQNEEEQNIDVIPTVPALKSDNPDEKESCPVCREEFELGFKHDD